jgi:aspartyl-tRNA(Asn)/glutamyl-tRNA(Gln) amidotransferase subunit A
MELIEALRDYAKWLGSSHDEDASAWIARLAVNQPEIERLRAAPTPGEPIYRPSPTPLTIPPGSIAAAAVPEGAMSLAIDKANQAAGLAVFTALADQAPQSAIPAGFLGGLPIVVKDLMAVKGFPLTGGTRSRPPSRPEEDATAVARLRARGACIVGLTNLHELAYGITSANPHFGAVTNPRVPDRTPGGSSGGTAAAIAAGIVAAGVGTDTAGSVRIPAACCGVVGFKPSYDAVPRDGALDLAPTLDHLGPLGARVSDCARLFAAMLGMDRIPDWQWGGLQGVRLARLRGYFEEPLDAAVESALTQAVAALRKAGASVEDLALPGIADAAAIQFHTICAEASATHADILDSRGLGEDVRARLAIGRFLPGFWYVKAQRMRSALVRSMETAFAKVDFWVAPTLRTPPPPVGATEVSIGNIQYPLHTALTQLTMPFNLSGLPAISIPWGTSKEGIPLAVQLVGRRGSDWSLLALADVLEQLAPAK